MDELLKTTKRFTIENCDKSRHPDIRRVTKKDVCLHRGLHVEV